MTREDVDITDIFYAAFLDTNGQFVFYKTTISFKIWLQPLDGTITCLQKIERRFVKLIVLDQNHPLGPA